MSILSNITDTTPIAVQRSTRLFARGIVRVVNNFVAAIIACWQRSERECGDPIACRSRARPRPAFPTMTQRRSLIVQQEKCSDRPCRTTLTGPLTVAGLRQRVITQPRPKADVHVSFLNSRLGGAKFAYIGHLRSCASGF